MEDYKPNSSHVSACETAAFVLREPGPGDLGWIVERHGTLYFSEYGWGERFEGITAEVIGSFVREYDSSCERCWIAEHGDRNVGSILLSRHRELDNTARLRLLLVEPSARGLGIGRALVRECTKFATHAGYDRIVLWTCTVLRAARRLYADEGYTVVRTEPFSLFGPELMGETWQLNLARRHEQFHEPSESGLGARNVPAKEGG
jgi:GNAT superfamily N-acetyltransferase